MPDITQQGSPAEAASRRSLVERVRIVLAGALIALGLLVTVMYFVRRHENRGEVKPVTRLPVEIRQTAQGFTLARSQGGRTLFRITAANATELQAGQQAVLRGVRIEVFQPNGNDQIYGEEFRYDPTSGNVVAASKVSIDLTTNGTNAPNTQAQGTTAPPTPIHVDTNGLTFNSKTGTGVLTGGVAFRYLNATGHADNAYIESRPDVLTLDGHVVLDWMRAGNVPVHVSGTRARFDRDSNSVKLFGPASAETPANGAAPGANSSPQRITADEFVVHLRSDYSPQHAEAEGHVHATGVQQGSAVDVTASQATADFRPAATRVAGAAAAATAAPPPSASSVELAGLQLSGGVDFHQRATDSDRQLTAGRDVFDIGENNTVRALHASENASVAITSTAAGTHTTGATSARRPRRNRNAITAQTPSAAKAAQNQSPANAAHQSPAQARNLAAFPDIAFAGGWNSGPAKRTLSAPALDFFFAAAHARGARKPAAQKGAAGPSREAVALRRIESVGHAHLESTPLPASGAANNTAAPTAQADADKLTVNLDDNARPALIDATGNVHANEQSPKTTPRGAAETTPGNSTAANASAIVTSSTTADALRLRFHSEDGRLQSAVETGHVQLRQTAAAEKRELLADNVDYQADSDVMHARAEPGSAFTSGRVTATEPQLRFSAPDAVLQRTTGVLTAMGGVQMSFLGGASLTGARGASLASASLTSAAPSNAKSRAARTAAASGPMFNSSLPVNVTADSATVNQNTGVGHFAGHVRIWQGPNVTLASEVDFDRAHATLHARGGVLSTFVQQPSAPKSAISATNAPAAKSNTLGKSSSKQNPFSSPSGGTEASAPVTIEADAFDYSDTDRHARYQGHVVMTSRTGRLTAPTLDIYLAAAAPTPRAGQPTTAAGIDHAIASGGVSITQPQREAKADTATYDFKKDVITLQGGSPSIYDAEHGFVTGHSLTFSPSGATIRVESQPGTKTFGQYSVAPK